MKKIRLIISREYITRVRKRSFIVMSILGPVIFASFIILPAWFSQMEDKEEKNILVIDNTGVFNKDNLPETEYIKFTFKSELAVDAMKLIFKDEGYYALLHISDSINKAFQTIQLYSYVQPPMGVNMHIKNVIEKEIERQKLDASGIDEKTLKSIETKVEVATIHLTDEGKEKHRHTGMVMAVGYICGFLIYIFIFMFGAQVMRGVLEEKTNRIVEVIVSSVKPFQLMMGKIIGIGGVALTQFAVWIVLTLILITGFQIVTSAAKLNPNVNQEIVKEAMPSDQITQEEAPTVNNSDILNEIKKYLSAEDFKKIIIYFIIFFLGGYILYASLFAIVGAASDVDTDTQQFMMPITIPLILAIIVMANAIQNPGSQLSFWFSMIPLTSPIVMMVRIPFEVPGWQKVLSIVILIASFIGTTWMAGKIYRTGILMYGKKVTYKELWKWLKYKN